MRNKLWEQPWILSTGRLLRVRIDDVSQAERRVTTLMGDREPRRKWIESHVQFTLEEDGVCWITKKKRLLCL